MIRARAARKQAQGLVTAEGFSTLHRVLEHAMAGDVSHLVALDIGEQDKRMD